MGTYEPEVNNLVKTKVTKRPKCEKETKLVFGIKSIAPNQDRREVIRKTWGAGINFPKYKAKVVFLLGIEEKGSNRVKVKGFNRQSIPKFETAMKL